MILAVIFDMDGLMFDTERLCTWATEQTGKEMGREGLSGFAKEVIGLREAECKRKYFMQFGEEFPFEQFSRRRQEIIDRYIREKGVPVKPGLFELLNFLKRGGFPMAVATSTSRRHALAYLERTGAAPYFDQMMFGDMLENGKPAPDIYLKAASLLEVAPEDCMALEDSPRGIQSAHAAGMTTVMIPDLLPPDQDDRKRYDYCVPSLFEVPALLQKERKEGGT